MSSLPHYQAAEMRPLLARLRERLGERALAAALALGLEALLLLALIALGQQAMERKEAPMATVSFDARDYSEKPPAPQPSPEPRPAAAAPRAAQPAPVAPAVTPIAPPQPPAAIIPVSPQQMPSFDLAKVPTRPKAPAGPAYGPAFTPAFGDSKRVGTTPNGQPMYAASWYREPTDQELRGYLSTATGPGWGLITCKTVADYRVEDCVGLDEYPQGSNMLRAVLAAAWQFRVRPPRVGGVSQVGDWVRIRIEYDTKPANPYEASRTR
jgi:protein TonB